MADPSFLTLVKFALGIAARLASPVYLRPAIAWSLRRAVVEAMSRLASEGKLHRGPGALDDVFFLTEDVRTEIAREFDPTTSFGTSAAALVGLLQNKYERPDQVDVVVSRATLEEFILHLRSAARRHPILLASLQRKEQLRHAPLSQQELLVVREHHVAIVRKFRPRHGEDFVEPNLRVNVAQGDQLSTIEAEESLVVPGLSIFEHLTKPTILVGRSGRGKTTLLARLARQVAETSMRIPILIHAAELQQCATVVDLQSLITDRILGDVTRDVKAKCAKAAFEQDIIVLFLDGLDQVQNPFVLEPFFRNRELWGRMTVVAAGRPSWPLVETAIQAGWLEVKIERFSAQQVREFLGRFADDPGVSATQNLLGSLIREPVILSIVKDLVSLGKLGAGTGRTRSELYETFIQHLIQEQRDQVASGMGGDEPFPVAVIQDLELLAYRTLEADHVARFQEVAGLEALSGDERKFERLRRFDFVRVVDRTEGVWEFRHQSFQEYLASGYIFNLFPTIPDGEIQRSLLSRLIWEEPLLFLASRLEDSSRLVSLCLEVDPVFAGLLLGQSRQVGSDVGDRVFQVLRNTALCGHDRAAYDALESLVLSQDPRALDVIAEAIKHPSERVSHEAEIVLDIYASEIGIDRVIALLDDESATVRRSVCSIVGENKVESAVSRLVELLDDADEKVVGSAAGALAEIGAVGVDEQLRAALERCSSDGTTQSILSAIGSLRLDNVIPAVRNIFNEGDDKRKQWAIRTLAEVGAQGWLRDLLQWGAASRNHDAGNTVEHLVVSHATPEDMPELMVAFREYPTLTHRLARAVVCVDQEAAIAAMAPILQSSDQSLCHSALRVLELSDSDSAVPLLISVCESRSSSHVAFRALACRGTEAGISALSECRRHEDPTMRSGVIHAVVAASKQLETEAAQTDPRSKEVSERANQCLTLLAKYGFREWIIECLSDSSKRVRLSAAEAASALRLGNGVEQLEKIFLQDEGASLIAGGALRRIGASRTVSLMLRCLDDPRGRGTDQAILFLTEQRIMEAGPRILAIARGGGPPFCRSEALTALPALRPHGSVDALLHAAQDVSKPYEEWVRRSALRALVNVDDPRIDSMILNRLQEEQNATAWMAAADVAGRRRIAESISFLEGRFLDPQFQDPGSGQEFHGIEAQRVAISAICAIGGDEAGRVLKEVVCRTDGWRREVAMWLPKMPMCPSKVILVTEFLCRQGVANHQELLACLDELSPAVRLGVQKEVLLNGSSYNVGRALLKELSNSDDPEARTIVARKLLATPQEFFWRELSEIADYRLVDELRALSTGPSDQVRWMIEDLERHIAHRRRYRFRIQEV